MTDINKPVPKPRRNVIINAEPTGKQAYENVHIDIINKNIDVNDENLQNNNAKPKLPNNKNFSIAQSPDGYRSIITELNNLNVDKTNKANTEKKTNIAAIHEPSRPVPAPRRVQPATVTDDIYENAACSSSGPSQVSLQSSTGAISKQAPPRPEPPKKVNNLSKADEDDIRHRMRLGSAQDFDGEQYSPPTLRKAASNDVLNKQMDNDDSRSSAGSSKYKTHSPGEILKSIGATSRLLTDSITERVTNKSKKAKHKLDKNYLKSKDKLSDWGTEKSEAAMSTLKNVRKRINSIQIGNLSLSRPKDAKSLDNEADRPHTLPVNDDIFQSISFNSPLNTKTNHCNNLNEADSSYEVPKSTKAMTTTTNLAKSQRLSIADSDSSMSLNSSAGGAFERNIPNLTQSMYSHVGPKLGSPLPPLTKIRSETNIYENTAIRGPSMRTESPSSSSEDSVELPCPSFPAPVLDKDGHYGKLKKSNYVSSTDSGASTPVRVRRSKEHNKPAVKPHALPDCDSTRATIDSEEYDATPGQSRFQKIFSRDVTGMFKHKSEENRAVRSDSWALYDCTTTNEDDRSSPEPIYENEIFEPVYGKVFTEDVTDMLLTPQAIQRVRQSWKHSQPSTSCSAQVSRDVLDEFDPLCASNVNQIFENKSNHLILLENLLAEDTYGTTTDDRDDQSLNITDDDDDDASSESSSVKMPAPPERQDSLYPHLDQAEVAAASGQTATEPSIKMIVHQNPNLRAESLENLIEPYLSKVDDTPLNDDPVDLKRSKAAPRTQWFLDNVDQINKPIEVNPVNSKTQAKPIDKVSKSGLPKKRERPKYDPPPYSEAMREEPPPIVEPSKKTSPPPQQKTSVKSMFNSVMTKMEGIRRKSSFKGTSLKGDVKTIIEMIPRPTLASRYITQEGQLVRLPSGVVEDILKELHLRKAILRDKKFQTFMEKEPKAAKENFPLEYVTTIQCVTNHKFSNNSLVMYCFEITTAIPKGHQSNLMLSSTNSGNAKSQRVCHLYGVGKESERNIWMQKFVESLTDVFPPAFTSKYYRAGWCYLKNSITSQWSGSWLMLQKQKRKLLFHSSSDNKLESMDLRKARCIVLKDSDESINNLHVETGPTLMIDCPPYSIYVIMSSPRETKIWRHIVKEVAHNNGSSLKEQQLTKDDIPVLVDKCINFIYAHGSMSEGIFRKSGSENAIQKLLTLFRTDAFNLQITRGEYNEHDVANALKRFMRDLPDQLLGKFAASFISVGEMSSKTEKIKAYKELLSRLPSIEYHTLRKIAGHLNFINSQRGHNKMGVDNLSMIWGPTLLQNKHSEVGYSQKEANVISDLILLYKNLYQLTADEVKKEHVMLTVLQKYHAAAENLSDSVKKSGDLKVWITLNDNPDNEKVSSDELPQVNVTLTPTKTVYEVCKELAPKMKRESYSVTLNEIIMGNTLRRPLHYSERILDVVLRWSYWSEADCKKNYIELRPTKFMYTIQRALRNLAVVTPNKELKFADSKTKPFKSFTLELIDDKISVLKKEKTSLISVRDIDLRHCTAYLGCEKKRDFQLRWAITLVDVEAKKKVSKGKDSGFAGHVIAGTNSNDQIVWFSGIWHSLYGDDILPNPEMIIP